MLDTNQTPISNEFFGQKSIYDAKGNINQEKLKPKEAFVKK